MGKVEFSYYFRQFMLTKSMMKVSAILKIQSYTGIQMSKTLSYLALQGEDCRMPEANEPFHDKTSKITVRPAKPQISLGIRPV